MQQILENLYLGPSSSPSQSRTEHSKADHRGHAIRLSVTGELDIATVDSLSQVAIGALRLPVRVLVLDIHGVTFCGAAGVSTLIKIRQAASETGTRLVLAGIQPQVNRVLDLVGFSAMVQPLAGGKGSPTKADVGASQGERSHAPAGAVQPNHSRPLQAA